MKKDIHPEYKKTVLDDITVEICNNCHPFYTGNQKIVDTEGRVERFKRRYQNQKTQK